MRKSSFLIRFIDVGLIILFGFIIISDITIRSQIELPGADTVQSTVERDLRLFIINILPANQYQLADFIGSTVVGIYEDVESLEKAVVKLNNEIQLEGRTLVALIEPHETVTMQRLINILDLCDAIGIPKNINVESMRL